MKKRLDSVITNTTSRRFPPVKKIPSSEEVPSSKTSEDESADDKCVLHSVDCDLLFGEQLSDIVVRLKKRRPDTSLHTCGEHAVDAGKKTPDDGTDHGEYYGSCNRDDDSENFHGSPFLQQCHAAERKHDSGCH